MLDLEDSRYLRKLVEADIAAYIKPHSSNYGYEVALKWRKAVLKKLELLSK